MAPRLFAATSASQYLDAIDKATIADLRDRVVIDVMGQDETDSGLPE